MKELGCIVLLLHEDDPRGHHGPITIAEGPQVKAGDS